MSYQATDMHKFIRRHLELNGCGIDEKDNHFSVKHPDQLLPTKYTYNPDVSESQKFELITPGSRFFNTIVKDSLNQGIVSSISIESGNENHIEQIKSFFNFKDERCTECAKNNYEMCPKLIKCGHKVNGATVKNVNQLKKLNKTVLQFYFLVEFNNRFRKSEEIIPVAVTFDEDIVAPLDVYDSRVDFKESQPAQNIESSKYLKKAVNHLKLNVKKKIDFFNKQLDYEIAKKIQVIEKKFKDEKMEKLLNKEKFDVKEWEKTLQRTIESEKKSLGTIISIKLINCLVINAPLSKYSIDLSNGGNIELSIIDKFDKTFHPKCHSCSKRITEGYATEDRKYVCESCILKCIETGKVFSVLSKDRMQTCATSGEILSEGAGFRCANCNSVSSKHFMYRSSDTGEPVCVKCYDFCTYCDNPFSSKNMNTCKESGKPYCKQHSSACGKCNSFVGLDQAKFSGETQGAFCSCIDGKACKVCEDYYSDSYLANGKCQACNNLKMLLSDNQEVAQIRKNKDYERVTDWLAGSNRFNKIIVAKGDPVDSIFVARPGMIRLIKKARLSDL